MTASHAWVVIGLCILAGWSGYRAYMIWIDLKRRWEWTRKHDEWQRRNAAYLAYWRKQAS